MKNEQYKRVKEILEGDRLGIGGDCKEAIIADLEQLLSAYFRVNGVKIEIESEGSGFLFSVKAHGEAFKNFRRAVLI